MLGEKQRVHVAAVDVGAGSGRVMLASFDGDRIELTEAHRFETPLGVDSATGYDLLGQRGDRSGNSRGKSIVPTQWHRSRVSVATPGVSITCCWTKICVRSAFPSPIAMIVPPE